MSSSTRTPRGTDGAAEVQQTIPHVILLPDKFGNGTFGAGDTTGKQDVVEKAAHKLARRFKTAFVLRWPEGIVRLDDFTGPGERRLKDVSPEAKNVFLLAVQRQLAAELRPGVKLVVLLAGPELTSFRRLAIPCFVPLAGMSLPYRRRWLDAMATADDFTLGYTLFGGPAEPNPCRAAQGAATEEEPVA